MTPIFFSCDKEEGSKHLPKSPSQGGYGCSEGQGAGVWQSVPEAGVDCPGESGAPHRALLQSPRARGPDHLSEPLIRALSSRPSAHLLTLIPGLHMPNRRRSRHVGPHSVLSWASEGPGNMCASHFSSNFLRFF